MNVRAKFTVNSITTTKFSDGLGSVIKLSPVMSGSEENKDFYKWTPSGFIELGTINEGVAKSFIIGKEYYVDFSPACECADGVHDAVNILCPCNK